MVADAIIEKLRDVNVETTLFVDNEDLVVTLGKVYPTMNILFKTTDDMCRVTLDSKDALRTCAIVSAELVCPEITRKYGKVILY